jgi:hypothetical protein
LLHHPIIHSYHELMLKVAPDMNAYIQIVNNSPQQFIVVDLFN